MEESPYVQVMRVNDLLAQRNALLEAAKAALEWAVTDIQIPKGDFRYFAEEVVPMLDEAIKMVEGA
ncbi:hypothetical protein Rctr71_051 [Virus Rctr71]|nr:hypothetical protein Rctr71_051 [Virus Rctr71]